MDGSRHQELIRQILSPTSNPVDKDVLLKDLGLDGLPSPEHVHREIEEKLLLPRETLPSHWLPTYQVYGCLRVHVTLFNILIGTGTRRFLSLRCLHSLRRHHPQAWPLLEPD
jgi:hypothetical protein